MSVDKDTVRRIAKLARLAVPENLLEPMAGELNRLLAWVADTRGLQWWLFGTAERRLQESYFRYDLITCSTTSRSCCRCRGCAAATATYKWSSIGATRQSRRRSS